MYRFQTHYNKEHAPVSVFIVPITLPELTELAQSHNPGDLQYAFAEDALPPAFVAARALTQISEGQSEQWCRVFYIVKEPDNMIIGSCGFKSELKQGSVEIGYSISTNYRGQGAATTAIRQLVDDAFSMGAAQVVAEILPDNLASARVVQKLHFKCVGPQLDTENELVDLWVLQRQ
ncbi:GNAT family N-acetyltransferase [Undibacterium sp. RTI2.1]|uniref:GNAT family N-acetyltransferase n=1 Tax=unclassified Undibacterium TaxID=2630295 RepID=UPI002AB470AB|nr:MULTISPECIES: GNAT family N-acetyltransferase [unclassified Undibacterium]MDY7539188.1 GNAT family N-acetyltransferase [Undibacterium sp. 5I1]MEB0031040.1 GNAT family N-acetyltransferase [Undibacterium sp. RTI2.1]MEB0116273.1 GNAT family N-acetyltransferase [Undibacterium sp. RTI2.2]MEB0231141.1 GNAT family N-acetyltransferase [Undibacterium sp. 10I3]MEB0257014.1 GNAT family N-acetyltransferase [Undibacterium sp. 5I1]